MVVSSVNSSNVDGEFAFSCAGQGYLNLTGSEHVLCTYYNANSAYYDVRYKDVNYASASLRLSENEELANVYPNPFTTEIHLSFAPLSNEVHSLTLSDMTGKI